MNKELVDYIKQQTEINVPKNKITNILLKQGWHQSEIDDAFLASGAGIDNSEVSAGGGFEDGRFDDPDQDKNGFGSSQKMLFAVAGVLAVLAIIAGIAVFSPLGDKKEETAPSGAGTTTTDLGAGDAAVNQPAGGEEAEVDTAVLTSIEELETSIQPPFGWVAREGTIRSRPLAAFFKAVSEKDSYGKTIFNENISVTLDNFASAGVSDEAAYIAKSKTTLQEKIENYKMLTESKVSLGDGSEATMINSSFTQNGLDLKNMQMFAVKNDNVYIITGVALASNWDKEKDMIGMAIMSFKFPSGQ
ncbi:MAG: DcrB-related protein [Minisyncoccales bacterium]